MAVNIHDEPWQIAIIITIINHIKIWLRQSLVMVNDMAIAVHQIGAESAKGVIILSHVHHPYQPYETR